MNRLVRKTVAAIMGLALLMPVAASAETTTKKPWTSYQEIQETCIDQAEQSWRCDFWRYILGKTAAQ